MFKQCGTCKTCKFMVGTGPIVQTCKIWRFITPLTASCKILDKFYWSKIRLARWLGVALLLIAQYVGSGTFPKIVSQLERNLWFNNTRTCNSTEMSSIANEEESKQHEQRFGKQISYSQLIFSRLPLCDFHFWPVVVLVHKLMNNSCEI